MLISEFRMETYHKKNCLIAALKTQLQLLKMWLQDNSAYSCIFNRDLKSVTICQDQWPRFQKHGYRHIPTWFTSKDIRNSCCIRWGHTNDPIQGNCCGFNTYSTLTSNCLLKSIHGQKLGSFMLIISNLSYSVFYILQETKNFLKKKIVFLLKAMELQR